MSIEMLMKPDGEGPRDINDNDVKQRIDNVVERKPTLVIPEPKRLSPLALVPDVRLEKKSPISPSITTEVPGFPHLPWQPPFYPALSNAFPYLPYRLPGLPFPPLPEHLTFPTFLEHLRPNSSFGTLYNQIPFPHPLSQYHLPLRQDKLLSFEKRSFENDVNLMKNAYESGNLVPTGSKSEIEVLKATRESVKGIENNEKKPTTIIEPTKYQCTGCQKNYSTFSGLSKHKQFHCTQDIKREFTCKYCDKTYVSLGALKMHIRTHTLPCKCKICGKAFSRPWLLQGHYRTHTGEKPFSCVHCLRAFADRSNLRAHLQTHSDVKKYSCKTCSKTFSRMSLLVKHEESCRNSMEL